MRIRTCTALFLLLSSSCPVAALGGIWSLQNGGTREGEALAFDFEKKELSLSDPITGKTTVVPTADLSLRSRQRLLLSPLFYKVERGNTPAPVGQDRLPLYALAAFTGVVVPGFWLSAWFLNGRINPFLAVFASLGSWIVLGILLTCYTFLSLRFEGAISITLLGTIMTLALTPLYVSAVYSCTYLRGLLLFGAHLVVALALFAIGLVLVEFIAGTDPVDAWWNEHVFKPVGLTSLPSAEDSSFRSPTVPSAT